MKKLFSLALAGAVAAPLFAQEAAKRTDEADKAPQQKEERRESAVWPAFFAVCEFPANPDIIGLRLTLPFSTKQENITGIDLGLWGRAMYFQGFQVNILRNDVKDELAGFQAGLYNSVGGGQLVGLQAGLFNEANSMRGAQVGIVNFGGEVQGFQIGLINRTETMVGYQVGLINVIRDAELQFCPIVNIGF
ncbi:MAG: hypothetical protein J6T01_02360 [Kiritimatiellae bacterium]|nr:hypothetical protein [Kiritimatiellia bacterium]